MPFRAALKTLNTSQQNYPVWGEFSGVINGVELHTFFFRRGDDDQFSVPEGTDFDSSASGFYCRPFLNNVQPLNKGAWVKLTPIFSPQLSILQLIISQICSHLLLGLFPFMAGLI